MHNDAFCEQQAVHNTRVVFIDAVWDSHLQYFSTVCWEQSSKVNRFFLYTLCMKLSNLLCLSFFLQDDKRKVSLVPSLQWDTSAHKHMWSWDVWQPLHDCTAKWSKTFLFYWFSNRELSAYCREQNNSLAVWHVSCLIKLISHPTRCGYPCHTRTQNWDRQTPGRQARAKKSGQTKSKG